MYKFVLLSCFLAVSQAGILLAPHAGFHHFGYAHPGFSHFGYAHGAPVVAGTVAAAAAAVPEVKVDVVSDEEAPKAVVKNAEHIAVAPNYHHYGYAHPGFAHVSYAHAAPVIAAPEAVKVVADHAPVVSAVQPSFHHYGYAHAAPVIAETVAVPVKDEIVAEESPKVIVKAAEPVVHRVHAAPVVAHNTYALPTARQVVEAPIVHTSVEKVEQHGYSVSY